MRRSKIAPGDLLPQFPEEGEDLCVCVCACIWNEDAKRVHCIGQLIRGHELIFSEKRG